MVAEIDLRLVPEPEGVTNARHALDQLADILPPEKLENVRLVVSELVANSVRHAGLSLDEQILLSLMVSGRSVRGRVCDPGPASTSPRSQDRGPT